MVDFLDAPSFNFALPAVQTLHELLWTNIDGQRAVRAVLQNAGVRAGLVNMEQPMYLVWHEILDAAAKQGKMRALLDAVRREPLVGPALAPRLDELSQPVPPLDTAPHHPGELIWSGEEVFTGEKNTLLDVSFLGLGAERARSVVRLHVSFGGATSPSIGTGFLIGPDLVMSNHHVLFRDGRPAERVTVWFDYEVSAVGAADATFAVAGEPDSIRGDRDRDGAVFRLWSHVDRPALPVEANVEPLVGDRVYIIQHPAGGPKKVGLMNNDVRHVDASLVQYLTDTLPGSSGSPVFNEHWNIVAVHHRSVMGRTSSGAQEIRNQGFESMGY